MTEMSTEIIDLLPPAERLAEVYKKFVSCLEKDLEQDEKRLDETFEVHRTKLHRAHLKIVRSYEVIFNKMLQKLNENDHIPLITLFEKALRSKNIAMYSAAAENLLPNLDNVEKYGGTLTFSSKIVDDSYGSRRHGDYFSFYNDFWGIDDIPVFKVKKEYERSWDMEKNKEKKQGFTVIPQEPSTFSKDVEELRAFATAECPFGAIRSDG